MLDTSRIRESIRNRPLVREQSPMRGRELIGYLTLCSLIALPAVFGLWQQSDFVRTRFAIESLRKEKLALQERYRCLRIERGTLESLERIEEVAKSYGLGPRPEKAPPIIVSSPGRRSPSTGLPPLHPSAALQEGPRSPRGEIAAAMETHDTQEARR